MMSSVILLLIIFIKQESGYCYETEDVVNLRATAGRNAYLPCGQEKVFLDGPGSYVAWMKDEQYIYRFPNDETEYSAYDAGYGMYYGDADHNEVCERSNGCVDRTSLMLKNVTSPDAGIYSCRVHYVNMPSADYVISVTVVPCPQNPRIYSNDAETSNGYIGPVSLGTNLKLKCKLEQADKDTTLYWRRNGQVLTEQSRPVTMRPLVITLLASNLQRDQLDAQYECIAQNSDVSEPVIASITIKMFLPPLSVEIRMNDNGDFTQGEPRIVDCIVVGCVPPPTITWNLGDKLLKSTSHKEHSDGNFTVSTLSVSPALSDRGASLVCRAHNPYMLEEVYQHAVIINVGFKPMCVRAREEVVGVVELQSESVTCTVLAVPEPGQFIWTFGSNRTAYTTAKRISGQNHRYSSTLTFVFEPEDLGMLECRAVSSFGTQEQPCLFSLVPGGAPATPTCTFFKSDPKSGRIECNKDFTFYFIGDARTVRMTGFDGGRAQIIHLEIITEDGLVVANQSNSLGHFPLENLEDKQHLLAKIYASNNRGKSSTVKIEMENTEPLQVSNADLRGAKFLVPGVIGISLTLVVLVICTSTVEMLRKFRLVKRNDHVNNEATVATAEDQCPDVVPISMTDGSFHRQPEVTRVESAPVQLAFSPFYRCTLVTTGNTESTPCHSTSTLQSTDNSCLERVDERKPRALKQHTFFV